MCSTHSGLSRFHIIATIIARCPYQLVYSGTHFSVGCQKWMCYLMVCPVESNSCKLTGSVRVNEHEP